MSAAIVGLALIALPFLGVSAYIVREDGWSTYFFLARIVVGSMAIAGVMTAGAYLLVEGWPT